MRTQQDRLSTLATLVLADGITLTREGNRLEFTETVRGFDPEENYFQSHIAAEARIFDHFSDENDGESTDFTGIVDLSDDELGKLRNLVDVMETNRLQTLLLERSDLEDLEPHGCFVDVPSDWERENLGQLVEVSA